MAQCSSHWFAQGGASQFGALRDPKNPDELISDILTLVRAQLRAAEASLRALRETNADLLRCLQFVESVYRQNCVVPGEPSSVLNDMQQAIARAALTGSTPTPVK